MISLSKVCDQCKKYVQIPLIENQIIACPECSKDYGTLASLEKVFDHCPVCQGRQFYIQKDFNQALGCLVMLIGIVFVPFTLGLSLPLFAVIDWFLYRRISSMAVCYRCHSEFRGFKIPVHLKPFMHHIGAKYDR